jgi:hypothetical protein
VQRVVRPDLFSSNTLFGQPGLYPDASPMVPATGESWTDERAREPLAILGPAAAAAWEDSALAQRAPMALARAALAGLVGTIAEPMYNSFVAGNASIGALTVGELASPGRVVGALVGSGPTDEATRGINARYAFEHPLSVAPSLAHDLAWSGTDANHAEETTLHLVVALVHTQLIARRPELAHTGTELARRQNSLALPLLCSHAPDSSLLTPVAPSGAGTAPGGDPKMSTPDFWSIPFGPPGPGGPIPESVIEALTHACASANAVTRGEQYSEDVGTRLSSRGLAGALARSQHLRAAVALGLVTAQDLADASGLSVAQVPSIFGIGDALSVFDRA